MGVTVHYRGSINHTRLIETFEDRIVELALDMGGMARIWRSCPDDNPARVVKGATLELAEGLETASFILSPEGMLVPLHEIEAAENAPFFEPPWIFCKTQFGSVDAHIALIELLKALKGKFFSNLEVMDEGQYYETGNLRELCRRRGVIERGIKAIAKELGTPKSDGDIQQLERNITTIAKRVQRTVLRPPEHPAVEFSESKGDTDERCSGTEEEWDAMYRENERKQSSLMRNMEERLAKGGDPAEAFDHAMRDEGITGLPSVEPESEEEAQEREEWTRLMNEAAEHALDELDAEESGGDGLLEDGEEGDDEDEEELRQHPLMERAAALLDQVMELPRKKKKAVESGFLDGMMRGLTELNGALAQVFMSDPEDDTPYGLMLVQLKRAQRGAAFFRGSLAPLLAEGIITKKRYTSWLEEVDAIESELLNAMSDTRRKLKGDAPSQ